MHKLWNWSGDANSQCMIYTSTSFYIKPNLDEFHLFFRFTAKEIMKNYTLYLVSLFLAGVVIGISSEFNHRSKRFLTFYRRNSAVVQVRAKNIGNNKYITPAKVLKFALICFSSW